MHQEQSHNRPKSVISGKITNNTGYHIYFLKSPARMDEMKRLPWSFSNFDTQLRRTNPNQTTSQIHVFARIFVILFFVLASSIIFTDMYVSVPFSFPRRNSDPGSLSRLFSPLQTTAIHAFIFIARRIQPFLASPTINSIELSLPTLLGALSS